MVDKQTWFERTHRTAGETCIAYFSAEFGLTGCLPIYSGGLGVLAGAACLRLEVLSPLVITPVFLLIILSVKCASSRTWQPSKITECSIDEFSIIVPVPMVVKGPIHEFLIWQSSAMDVGPQMRLFSIFVPCLISTRPTIWL